LSISWIYHQLFRYDTFLYSKDCFVVHPTLKEKPDSKDMELPFKAKPLQSHERPDNTLIYRVLLYTLINFQLSI